MHPARAKKIDISTLSEEEQKLFRLYGKLPTHKNVLQKMQKDRKYFDSGDYALSKAGKAPQNTVGTAIPNPENIPHASPPVHPQLSVSPTNTNGGGAISPVKESTLAQSVEDSEVPKDVLATEEAAEAMEETSDEAPPKPEAAEEAKPVDAMEE
ncbi:Endosulfine-domain-containing protein [Heliocybe sulcata]|uniref:mRNA stability protein n=1 Tax=Heliocybe sulcata TaxID=5364 RepID=A0A5C3MY52_9AGAM|nr:Endosulfine-domain-containing protein [Heliocybe sulcata]